MSENIKAELIVVFTELGLVTGDEKVEDIVFADLDADSLTLMDLCVELEDRLGFVIEPAEVMKKATLQNLARFIEERRPSGPRSSE